LSLSIFGNFGEAITVGKKLLDSAALLAALRASLGCLSVCLSVCYILVQKVKPSKTKVSGRQQPLDKNALYITLNHSVRRLNLLSARVTPSDETDGGLIVELPAITASLEALRSDCGAIYWPTNYC